LDNLTHTLDNIDALLEEASSQLNYSGISDIESAVNEIENAVSDLMSYHGDTENAIAEALHQVEQARAKIDLLNEDDGTFVCVSREGEITMGIGNTLRDAKVTGFSLASDVNSISIETTDGKGYTISGVITETDNTIRIGG
tara:strand:+ start:360 stop:782 length:423 start_codon:yes stop_codon:yes gene_type:complete